MSLTANKGTRLNKDELEKEIKQTIMKTVRDNLDPTKNLRQEQRRNEILKTRRETQEKYKKFHQLSLSSFTNRKDTNALKLGDGSLSGEGDDLFDGIFLADKIRIGLSVFGKSFSTQDSDIENYLDNVAKYIISNNIHHVVIVIDDDPSNLEVISNEIHEQFALYKDNPFEHLTIVTSHQEEIEKILLELKLVGNKMPSLVVKSHDASE